METDLLAAYSKAAAQWSPERHLMVLLLDQLRVISWKLTKLSGADEKYPQATRRPGTDPEVSPDAMTFEEADDWYASLFSK